jgi:hypothetical protein
VYFADPEGGILALHLSSHPQGCAYGAPPCIPGSCFRTHQQSVDSPSAKVVGLFSRAEACFVLFFNIGRNTGVGGGIICGVDWRSVPPCGDRYDWKENKDSGSMACGQTELTCYRELPLELLSHLSSLLYGSLQHSISRRDSYSTHMPSNIGFAYILSDYAYYFTLRQPGPDFSVYPYAGATPTRAVVYCEVLQTAGDCA